MVVPGGTEDMQLCCGRTAGGDEAGGRSRGRSEVLRFDARAGGNGGAKADRDRGCVDRLMADMADGAVVGGSGRIGVMMPDHAERRPQQ